MIHSPAHIIQKYLIAAGAGVEPGGTTTVWPIYINFTEDKPDNQITVYDTPGTQDGRLMMGKVIEHPGLQIRFRGKTFAVAYSKAVQIRDLLDSLYQLSAVVDVNTYLIQNVSRRGAINTLGREAETTRVLFTINAITTIKESP